MFFVELLHCFRFGWNYDGDMLGQEQWKWLEGELLQASEDERIRATVLVSSIQANIVCLFSCLFVIKLNFLTCVWN